MLVEKLMSGSAVSVAPDESVFRVATLMASRGVGSVLVTAPSGRRLGIITDRDLALRTVAADADPHLQKASGIMTRNPETVSPRADAREAAAVMAGGKLRRLPVVENGRPVGVISLGDIARSRVCDTEAGLALSHICSRDPRF